MIDLYLCRHGEASFDAPNDRSRVLTDRGIADTERAVQSVVDKLEAVQVLWCSDFLRAKQTAELVSNKLKIQAQEQVFLRPSSDPQGVIRKLAEFSEGSSVMLVAHMPLLGDLHSLLVEGNTYAPYSFKTSEIVHLQGDLLAAGLCSVIPL